MDSKENAFRAGVIIVEREPWVWSFQWGNEDKFCAKCFGVSDKLRVCSGCKVHRYCGEDCQRSDWKKEHKLECAMLKRISVYKHQMQYESQTAALCTTEMMILLKVLNRVKQNPDIVLKNVGKILVNAATAQKIPIRATPAQLQLLETTGTDEEEDAAREFTSLLISDNDDHLPHTSQSKMAGEFRKLRQKPYFRGLMEAAFPDKPDIAYQPLFNSDIADIHDRIHCRMLTITDYVSLPLPVNFGAGLFPGVERNHIISKCSDNNAVIVFRGRRLHMVAMEDIPSYTGISDARCCDLSLFPLNWPLKQRRELFQKYYERVCNCRKCTPEFEAEINPLRCVTINCPERIPSDERALLPCAHCSAVNGSKLQKLGKVMKKYDKLLDTLAHNEHNDTDSCEMLEERIRFLGELDSDSILHTDAHLRFALGWDVARYYAGTMRWPLAAQLYREIVPCLRKIYPKYHPHLARYLRRAGLFALMWFDHPRSDDKYFAVPLIKKAMSEGVDWLAESYRIYVKLCGENSHVASELVNTLEAAADMYRQLLRREEQDEHSEVLRVLQNMSYHNMMVMSDSTNTKND
ncbi:uncharacterized protein LOC129585171 isoform X2 [Paramacrobiotus metropolitanus]|uniref:uncharacterized protein LOC129585171 isoform X2 n=1 Tax=Paramacrobiotus metropolitanus TaxID=2943436 RepID=UPI0024458922|nr:uncharacterized protein LOC129585171 isoform X2 [Paramacrobiotus metropolitanus]